jgi:hypothetical protein
MSSKREPVVKPVRILSLKPTQLTVGLREVKEKRKQWRDHKPKKRAELLGRHMIPVVLGPDDGHYVIDHHHLARALHDEGEKDVLITVVADLSMVSHDQFWNAMDGHRFVHPYDQKGRRQNYSKLPKTVVQLKDDPYRSLAGELRRAGGFAKDTTPFSEFLWADFLRPRVTAKTINNDFAKAIEQALAFARSKDAIYLPGWCGPSSGD